MDVKSMMYRKIDGGQTTQKRAVKRFRSEIYRVSTFGQTTLVPVGASSV
jgi:hypothetical protein